MTDFFMPSMGESVMEGVVINVLVKPGDLISKGQTLLEVETDKVTFDVPAELTGILIEILVKEGDEIHPGDLLLKVDSKVVAGEEITENKITKDAIYALSPNDVAHQQLINTNLQEQPIVYPNESNGVLLAKETKKIFSTPLARKLARELGIEISEIGIAINKRISFNDVKIFAKSRIQQLNSKKLQNQSNITPPLPNFEKFGNVRHQDMAAIMVATSRSLAVSASNIPHAWVQEKVDITDLEANRMKHKSKVGLVGGSLTITVLVVKAVTKALQAFPLLNSSLDLEKNEIIFKEYFHIGIAVDTDRGLLVPVIRNVEKRNLTDIAIELTRISKEAKERKTKLEDLEGATFTISNLGAIGTTSMNPIVNWPQVAILGLSASQIEPIWMGNEFRARLRIPLTLGFDHRIINGADAARFLQYLKNVLEDPFLLFL